MDLSVSRPPKEKRERQPNWTEAEKQLLVSLTRIHHAVLENKVCDSMTIKRKSIAWDDIATNMRAAGYHRTKDKLKQQLGRIRAAEAKKVKDALVKGVVNSNSAIQSSIEHHFKREELTHKRSTSVASLSIENQTAQIYEIMPDPLHEELPIKIEKATTLSDFKCLPPSKERLVKTPIRDTDTNNVDDHDLRNNTIMVTENSQERGGELLVAPLKKKRKISFRISGRAPRSHAQRIRQLHLYRLAVERERLKNLRLQQRRDRVLFDKNMQIQNLKLQVLRNLANQNNHINL